MSWNCKECGLKNGDQVLVCGGCGASCVGNLILKIGGGTRRIVASDGSFILGRDNLGSTMREVDMSGRQMRFYVSNGVWKVVNISRRIPIRINSIELKTLESTRLEQGKECAIECGGLKFSAIIETE